MTISNWLKRLIFPSSQGLTREQRKDLRGRWQEIEIMIKEGKEKNYRLAVLEADKLFGLTLERSGFQEESWAKNLAKAKERFSNSVFQGLWQAHKTRNRIVHDHSHEFTSFESKAALKKFRRGMKELGIL